MEENLKICPHCGCPVSNTEKKKELDNEIFTEQKNEIFQKTVNKIKKILIFGTLVFSVLAGVFFYKAYDVKNHYYNSEYSFSNENAYVGGDAYNYIINGTYFAGYSSIGSSCMICAVIFGVVFIIADLRIKV